MASFLAERYFLKATPKTAIDPGSNASSPPALGKDLVVSVFVTTVVLPALAEAAELAALLELELDEPAPDEPEPELEPPALALPFPTAAAALELEPEELDELATADFLFVESVEAEAPLPLLAEPLAAAPILPTEATAALDAELEDELDAELATATPRFDPTSTRPSPIEAINNLLFIIFFLFVKLLTP